MIDVLNDLANNPLLHPGIGMFGGMFGGMRVIETAAALAETEERLFPASRHRSKRIHKKLVKRFGGEFRKVPTAYRLRDDPDTLYVHPAIYAELKRQTFEEADKSGLHARMYGQWGGSFLPFPGTPESARLPQARR